MFFSNAPATTEIYTLSLHDALPIFEGLDRPGVADEHSSQVDPPGLAMGDQVGPGPQPSGVEFEHRSEEHTSELQLHSDLVCRLLLEKKKERKYRTRTKVSRKLVQTE